MISNDRLLAPNDDDAANALAPAIERAASTVFAAGVTLARVARDPRERLAFSVTPKKAVTLAALVPA